MGNLDDFFTRLKLHYRRLHVACEQCDRSEHSLAIPCWRWLPALRYRDVSQFGSQLGYILAWLPLHCNDPSTCSVLHIWKQDQEDEQVQSVRLNMTKN